MSNIEKNLKREFLYKQAFAKARKIDRAINKILASAQKKVAWM